MLGCKDTQTLRVLFQSLSKALIGEVEQRQPTVSHREFGQLLPLLNGRINPCRVMAAAVEQHNIARLGIAQAVKHAVEVQRVFAGIVIVVFCYFQPAEENTPT